MDYFQIFVAEIDFSFDCFVYFHPMNLRLRLNQVPLSYYFKKVHVHDIGFIFDYF